MLQAIKSQHDAADLVSFPDEFAGVNEEEKKYLVYFIHNIKNYCMSLLYYLQMKIFTLPPPLPHIPFS